MIYNVIPQKTALLAIDIQKEYTNPDRPLFVAEHKETISKINDLFNICRKKGIPIIIVKHVHDPNGRDLGRMGDFSSDEVFIKGDQYSEIDPTLMVSDSDILVEKNRYSAFVNTNLESYLKTLDIDTLIITGFMTGYCCVTTTRHAHDLDYKVIYAYDANSGPAFGDLGFGEVTEDDIKRVIATLLAGGIAEVIYTDELIKRIEGGEKHEKQ